MPIRVTQIKLVDRIFLLGAPGIGKTEIVKQLAAEEAERRGKRFVDLREADSETLNSILEEPGRYFVYYRVIAPHIFPEDLGVPKMNSSNSGKEFIEFLPPKVLKILTLDGIEGVLFIDELTNVQRDDQLSMLYSLILEKEASWILKLSRGVKIVAAGNPPEWSEVTRSLPKPLRNRMTIVEVEPPTPDEWAAYMDRKYGDGWEKLVYAYVKMFKEDFIKPPGEDDYSAFPTPRSWTNLAVLLHQFSDANPELVEELVIGNVGREVGTKFIAVLKTKVEVRRLLEEVRRNPAAIDSFKVNEVILVLHAVAQQPIDVIVQSYKVFIEYLASRHREHLTLMIMLMARDKRYSFIKAFASLLKDVIKELAKYMG